MTAPRRSHSRGRPPHPDVLTPAEWRVLEELRAGAPNAEIAARLGVSIHTVKSHVSSMLTKLELASREELARWEGEPAHESRRVLERVRAGLLAPLGWFARMSGAGAVLRLVALGGGVASLAIIAGVAMSVALSEEPAPAPSLAGATETPVDSQPSPTTRPTPSPRPDQLPPVANPGPQEGETIAIDFGPARITLERYLGGPAPRVEGYTRLPIVSAPLLYDIDRDELWYLDYAAAWDAVFSPFDDLLVAWGFNAIGGEGGSYIGTAEPETVLVDLERRTVERLLPVNAWVRWTSATTLLARVNAPRGPERPHQWLPGMYEVDLVERTVTLLMTGERLAPTYWGGSLAVEVHTLAREGPQVIVVIDLTSNSSRQIFTTGTEEWIGWLEWVTASETLVFASGGFDVYMWRPGWDDPRLVEARGEYAFDGFEPSPDGRWLAISDARGTELISLVDPNSRLGPFEGTWPAAWHPDGSRLMLIADYCAQGPDAAAWNRLTVLDVAARTLQSVDSAGSGFWDYSWSPRGDRGIGQALTLVLVDAAADEATIVPWSEAFSSEGLSLDAFSPSWSATGRWHHTWGIAAGKGHRCDLRRAP